MFGYVIQLDREEVEETIDGLSLFKYLELPLEQLDIDWPVFRRNIIKARQVWVILGFILMW